MSMQIIWRKSQNGIRMTNLALTIEHVLPDKDHDQAIRETGRNKRASGACRSARAQGTGPGEPRSVQPDVLKTN